MFHIKHVYLILFGFFYAHINQAEFLCLPFSAERVKETFPVSNWSFLAFNFCYLIFLTL